MAHRWKMDDNEGNGQCFRCQVKTKLQTVTINKAKVRVPYYFVDGKWTKDKPLCQQGRED